MKLLIIEDEYSLADAIAEMLKGESFISTIITDGIEGEDEALTDMYDLILLDVMLPNKSGYEILKTIKNEKIHTPVIMLTAKSEIDDKLKGLEIGADDYITKPFNMKELIFRVRNLIKRTNMLDDTKYLEYGDIILNLEQGLLNCNDKEVSITGKELSLLEFFIINKNNVLNKDTIINKIWGYDADLEYNNVEVYISFLRKKLSFLNSNVKIKAIRGIGYKLEVIDDK